MLCHHLNNRFRVDDLPFHAVSIPHGKSVPRKPARGASRRAPFPRSGGNQFELRLASIFRQIHFVDLSMKRAATDAEFFGCSGHVAIGGCKRLGNQFSFCLAQVERTRFFTESLS